MKSILTVTTPAGSFDLTTKADVKTDLGITVSTYDAQLDRYISESSLQLALACDRVFGLETVSEQIRLEVGKTAETLRLARRPLTTITSVSENGTLLVAGADYEADKEPGLLSRLASDKQSNWVAGAKIVALYESGYSLPGSAPKDLQKAARALVKAQWLSKGRDPLVRSESVPGVYEVAYWVGGLPGGATWPSEIEAALGAYRNVLV